jgi:hypothetical protein
VLTAYAESDFKGNARSKNPVNASGYFSEGVFQQTLPWWKNDHFDVAASTNAFLDNFRKKWGEPVKDSWEVQRWNADINNSNFLTRPETVNYTNRLANVTRIIQQKHI